MKRFASGKRLKLAAAARCRFAVQVQKNAARHVISLDLVIDDHLPDLGARHVGRPTWERACNDLFQKAGVGYVIYPGNAVHVSSSDRVDGCDSTRYLSQGSVFQLIVERRRGTLNRSTN